MISPRSTFTTAPRSSSSRPPGGSPPTAPLPDDGARPGVARPDRRGPRCRIRPGDDRDRAPAGREVEPTLPYPDTTTRSGDPRAPGDEDRGAAHRSEDWGRGEI